MAALHAAATAALFATGVSVAITTIVGTVLPQRTRILRLLRDGRAASIAAGRAHA